VDLLFRHRIHHVRRAEPRLLRPLRHRGGTGCARRRGAALRGRVRLAAPAGDDHVARAVPAGSEARDAA
jgi:hypothetical protein